VVFCCPPLTSWKSDGKTRELVVSFFLSLQAKQHFDGTMRYQSSQWLLVFGFEFKENPETG
jgi:hypothetical protein